jgi:outer membrane receptor protein involved in Fe transport
MALISIASHAQAQSGVEAPAAAAATINQDGSASIRQPSSAVTGGVTSDSAGGIEEIIVTAQKREQRLNDVGMSITALSGSVLQERGITDARDLGKLVPGFTFAASGQTAPVYTIRGVGFFETSLAVSPAVTVYTDEVSLPYPIMTNLAGLDIERVEVLKGPQGTVFGQNSTGGAINFIAAKPTSSLSAGLTGSYGRFNDFQLDGYLSGPLSETLSFRLSARTQQADDWQKNYLRKDTIGKTDTLQGRLLMLWNPSDAAHFTLSVSGWRDKSDPQIGQFAAFTPNVPTNVYPEEIQPLAPRNNRAADWNPDFPKRNNDFYQISARGDISVTDNVTLTSISSYQELTLKERQDGDGFTVHSNGFELEGKIKSFAQELRVAGKIDRLNWLIGGNYSRDRTHDFQRLLLDFASGNQTIPGLPFFIAENFADQKITSKAVFGNVEYEVLDQVTLQAGARYTENKRAFAGCASGDAAISQTFEFLQFAFTGQAVPIAPFSCITLDAANSFAPGLVENTLNEHNTSWRLGVNWKPDSENLLYANVSKGYKAGSHPTLSGGFKSQYTPIKQESVIAYEAGFKSSLFGRYAQLNGAIFYYDYKGKQLRGKTLDPVFGPLDRLVSIPQSHLWGAELQLTARPMRGWDVNIGGTYLKSKIDTGIADCDASPLSPQCYFSSAGDRAKVIDGNPYPFTPKVQLIADTQYELAINDGLDAFVGVSATHNSSANSSIGKEELFRIKAYTLVDARVGLSAKDDQWRFSIWGRNLTNQYYWSSVVHYSDSTVRFTGHPATYGVSLSTRFN